MINLSGAVMLKVARSPFVDADAMLERLDGSFDVASVDSVFALLYLYKSAIRQIR